MLADSGCWQSILVLVVTQRHRANSLLVTWNFREKEHAQQPIESDVMLNLSYNDRCSQVSSLSERLSGVMF